LSLSASTRNSAETIDEIGRSVLHFADEALELSALTEDGFAYLSELRTDSLFHRTLANARELALRAEAILERPVQEGRCQSRDLLDSTYTEIKGPAIQELRRLFDVSRVPESGFTPPKYRTTYDALVDEALQPLFDEVLAREPGYTFALIVDLNVYVPTHNRIYMGVPQRSCNGPPFCETRAISWIFKHGQKPISTRHPGILAPQGSRSGHLA
jgi:methyl-accepting chemotaxis protein